MFSLLFPFFGKFAADNVKGFVEKTKMQVICSALIGAALFFAALFICLMLFFCMASFMSPVKAAAVMALLWLLAAFVGIICMKISLDKQKRAQQHILNSDQKKMLAGTALAAVPSLLALGVKSFRRTGLLAVLAAGAAATYGYLRSHETEEERDPPEA